MTWLYEGQQVDSLPEDCVGYVYCITNLVSGKKYIGKKLAKFSKTTYKTVKLKNGNKRRKKIKTKIDSDWQEYWGSNTTLQQDVLDLGSDKFTREILHYCTSKAICSYLEAQEQFTRRVLESEEYYNNIINLRVHGAHIFGKL